MATEQERLDWRFMATLSLATAAGIINNAAFGPFIPEIAADLNSSIPILGQVAAGTWLVSAIAGIFAGPLADHYGPRRLLIAGLLLTVLSALLVAVSQSYWQLVAGRIVGGFGFSAVVGVTFAIASLRYSGKARLRAMSVLASALSMTGILGVPLLTQIAGPFSWRGAWVFIAIMALVAILSILINIPAIASLGQGRFRAGNLAQAYRPLLQDRNMNRLFIGGALQGALFMAAMTYTGSFFIDGFGLTTQQFGLIATITGVGFFLGSLTAGRLTRFDLRHSFALTTLATGALLLAVFTIQGTTVTAVVMLTAAQFLIAIQAINIITLVSNETPVGQGTTLVVNESFFAMGAATGSAVGGLLIQIGGFPALGLGFPVFALLAILAVMRPRRLQAQ